MAEGTNIEWCDHTFNPWEGCQKVGPGCDHCYAETRNARFGGGQAPNWGPGAPRRRTSEGNWRKPMQWQANAAAFQAEHGRRQRVFCASLADWLDNTVSVQWRLDMLRVIFKTPDLDWLMLSKRIGNLKPMLDGVIRLIEAQLGWNEDDTGQPDEELRNWLADWALLGKAPGNVWIGVTVVNQEEADRDIPKLMAVPARVRFLSMEPLIGPIRLRPCWTSVGCGFGNDADPASSNCLPCGTSGSERCAWPSDLIDWVIVGGESGPGARPMHPEWARSLRDQCQAAGVPFLFKQHGEWMPTVRNGDQISVITPAGVRTPLQPAWHDWPDGLVMAKVGKKASGRLLDGVEHNGFPGEAR